MVFFALVTSIAIRACLSLTITQMVEMPAVDEDTHDVHHGESVCSASINHKTSSAYLYSPKIIAYVRITQID